MAQWYAKGKLKKGDEFVHESIIGSTFIGRIEEETSRGKPAIRPSIEGWARIYGHNTISIDSSDDPYAYGSRSFDITIKTIASEKINFDHLLFYFIE
jgi:4-hydroxyproline epimerase